MSLIDHSFWPTHHFKFGWIKTFSSNSLIWAILKTVTKFSNVIGYQQPDLSTNRKIFPCALRYSGRCTSFAIHERRNKSYIQVLLVKIKGTFALNYELVFVYCSVLMQGRGGLGAIYTFAAGNGGPTGASCAYNGYVNSIYTIAINGVNQDGSLLYYAEACPGIMATTYSTTSSREKVVSAWRQN